MKKTAVSFYMSVLLLKVIFLLFHFDRVGRMQMCFAFPKICFVHHPALLRQMGTEDDPS